MPRGRAWGDTLFGELITSGNQFVSGLLSEMTPSDTITVVRLVGHLVISPSSLIAVADGTQALDVGIGVSAEEAFNAAVLPDPNVAGDIPARGWLWRDRILMGNARVAGLGENVVEYGHVRFDIRAMRKVDRGILYVSMFNSPIAGTPQSITVVGIIRALCLT